MATATPITRCEQCAHELAQDALFCSMCGAPRAQSDGDPLVGQTIADRYRLLQRMGHGRSGTIYLAEHNTLKRRVAVKVLHPELARDELAVERFRREATTVGQLDNQHIVEVLDYGRLIDGRLYLAMEFLDGETVAARLAHAGPRPVLEVVDVLSQLADALGEAHAMGVVHRDLRPRNVMLTRRRGHDGFVKLLDFGLAKLVSGEAGVAVATHLGMTFADPRYMSPEEARGEAVDRRSDVYSLGLIAYEMLVGRPPFTGEKIFDVLTQHVETPPPPVRAARPDVPEWLEAVVLRMLAKDPAARFTTVAALHDALVAGAPHAVRAGTAPPAGGLPAPPAPSTANVPEPLAGAGSGPSGTARADETWAGGWNKSGRIAPPPPDATTPMAVAPVLPAATQDVTQPELVLPAAAPVARAPEAAPPSPSAATTAPAAPSAPVAPLVVAESGTSRRADTSGVSQLWFDTGDALAAEARARDGRTAILRTQDDFGESGVYERPRDPRARRRLLLIALVALIAVVALVVLVSWRRAHRRVDGATGDTASAPPPAPTLAAAPVPPDAAPAPAVVIDAAPLLPDAGPPDAAPAPAVTPPAPTPRPVAKRGGSDDPSPPALILNDSVDNAQADFYLKLARSALARGDAAAAAENFNKAREYDARSAEAIAGLGEVALMQGQHSDAAVHLEAAARLSPRSVRVLNLLGTAYLRSGKPERAAAAFRRALDVDPSSDAARQGLAASGATR